MNLSNSHKELFRSCEILFGTDLCISSEFLDYLQISGVKSAYRQRAMETHPDRWTGQNLRLHQKNTSHFHAVHEAYENLLGFLKEKETNRQLPCDHQVRGAESAKHSTPDHDRQRVYPRRTIKPIDLSDRNHRDARFTNIERYYDGPLPRRQLLFGHFLYYSGLANWRTIAKILTWQRTERPRLGELGRRFGMFNQQDVTTILLYKKPGRPFGETARILGLLSANQLKVLIFHQQRLQKKFGTILVEKNLIENHELQELLDQFVRHNKTFPQSTI